MRADLAAFQKSLDALAEAALRATGAQSFAFIEKGGAGRNDAIVEYPLRTDSAIAVSVVFTFCSDVESARARPRLDRIAAAMQAVSTAVAADMYAQLADRLADSEGRLLDSKIADRVRGYLTSEAESDLIEAVIRHVETVLRPKRTRVLLEQALSELEEEIEERQLVGEAKQILQARDSVSEEQAHVELRLRSRKSRKPLKDVARQVIANRQSVKGL